MNGIFKTISNTVDIDKPASACDLKERVKKLKIHPAFTKKKGKSMDEIFRTILNKADTDGQELRRKLSLACEWISEIAQIKNEHDPVEKKHPQKSWRGAVKGEYAAADRQWSFFCPVWHTGQAVKALAMAYPLLKQQKILDSAIMGADFIAANTIPGSAAGEALILAYENYYDKINVSAIIECMDGLFRINDYTENSYLDIFLKASEWIVSHAWLRNKGLFLDLYDPAKHRFDEKPYSEIHEGRPLLDDGIMLKAFRLSGRKIFRDVFFETADRLLRDEYPEGNWVNYPPCQPKTACIHPRHAYWWGHPMFMAYEESGDKKYLDCALRCCRWYARAQRRDGGMFRETYLDFNTDSFGHATSGIAVAMSMFVTAIEITKADEFVEPLALALKYCLGMQFTEPRDENLKGVILEKILRPDGTDRSPYYIRDLGTIFFIQAVAGILELGEVETC